MTRRVRFHADFKADLSAQLRWLETNRDDSWILRLRAALKEANELLARFPAAGTIERQEGDVALRRLILRNVPYLIWFLSDSEKPAADIWLQLPRKGANHFLQKVPEKVPNCRKGANHLEKVPRKGAAGAQLIHPLSILRPHERPLS